MSERKRACQDCQDELDAVLIGIADADTARAVRQHLTGCPDCARQAAELQQVLGSLLTALPAVPMPSGARERLLESARAQPQAPVAQSQPAARPTLPSRTRPRPFSRRWTLSLAAGLSAAAALAAFLIWPAAQPSVKQADVVINAGGTLILARSEAMNSPLVIRRADGKLSGVAVKQPLPAWYTEGVYSGGKAYLLDAANEQLVVLNVTSGKIERTYPVPGGAAGLAVKDGSVYVKSAASGELRIFKGASCYINKLAKPTKMPQADYMDAVLPLPERILVTQHTTGEIFALSPDGEKVLAVYPVGGAPVGLQSWEGQVLALDVQGRLLELGLQGQVERSLKVSGHPDKISVMKDRAYLTDRGGMVSVVDLKTFKVTQQRIFGKPMDIVAMPNGHLALADAVRGLMILNADLSEL
ncbi:hypothetical protein EHF33_11375 [Deinococcus psychrotolerans]|uniref:Putative zinc-finger domain-containing protein n=1 Tax=Deinococcus psychrotolerans TaxID=2489213 RepID=A0A3G8YCZ6_9DEIO|nr:zf-HC2 domain-containing protein [Deinococcus psychrotolerans]AZI43269.1 hypothetical protein EHF33_11375 [Deinococcus psychrotolerans]